MLLPNLICAPNHLKRSVHASLGPRIQIANPMSAAHRRTEGVGLVTPVVPTVQIEADYPTSDASQLSEELLYRNEHITNVSVS